MTIAELDEIKKNLDKANAELQIVETAQQRLKKKLIDGLISANLPVVLQWTTNRPQERGFYLYSKYNGNHEGEERTSEVCIFYNRCAIANTEAGWDGYYFAGPIMLVPENYMPEDASKDEDSKRKITLTEAY